SSPASSRWSWPPDRELWATAPSALRRWAGCCLVPCSALSSYPAFTTSSAALPRAGSSSVMKMKTHSRRTLSGNALKGNCSRNLKRYSILRTTNHEDHHKNHKGHVFGSDGGKLQRSGSYGPARKQPCSGEL